MDARAGHSVVITGGAQGIGRAIAQRLAGAGMHPVLLDTDAEAGREAAQALAAQGAVFVHGEAGDPAAVDEAVARAAALGKGLRAAVANAGISAPAPPAELSLEAWEQVLRTNLTGAFLLARAAAPRMAHGGAMVLIGSSRAVQSEPHWEAYAASKGGLVALAHALARSLGPALRVNCVSPGWIATEAWQKAAKAQPPQLSAEDHAQHPAGRVGRPEDVAALVRFLLSDEAGFITGAHYLVDGGMSRKMIYT